MKPYHAFFQHLFADLDPGDFPFRFTAEVTNHCNLRCTMCPREFSGRGYGHMDFELFSSLTEQAANRQMLFYPQGFGESFMHPEYPRMLRHLNESGVRYPVVITNVTYLDDANAHAIMDASVPVVILSVDGADPELFEELRVNADYERVCENAHRLFRLRDERGSELPHIILSVVKADGVEDSMDRFRAKWEPLMRDTDEIFECSYVTWAGAIPPRGPERGAPAPERTPCRMLYKTLTVYHDGRATPCCYDHACELEVGNANEESVESMWGGERLANLRRLHETGRFDEIPLCSKCPDWVP